MKRRAPVPVPAPRARALVPVVLLFLRLGAIAFGGPAAHVALIERECVRKRAWLSREQFLDLLGVANLIPGPTSTELAMHVGYHRAGWWGLLAAGLAFIAPSALLVGLLAALYMRAGRIPAVEALLATVQPVVLVVIADAVVPLARTALATPRALTIGLAALAGAVYGIPVLAVLLAAGLAHLTVTAWRRAWLAIILAAGPVSLAAASLAKQIGAWELFAYFVQVGALLFGSGYVLLPVLEQDLVHAREWLTSTQLVDAIAVGQATPGPVFTTATFIGYVMGGLPLAVAATAGMFLPAFVFSAISARYVERLRRSDAARRFLAGVNAAAVALIAWVVVTLGRQVFDGVAPALVCAGAAIAIFTFRINPTLVLAAAALIGVARGITAAVP